MNIKSLKTQFIGAIAMVLVAAIAMGSSTYAWFAMNTKVNVTGMEVRTTTGNNLLISETTAGNPTSYTNYKTSMIKDLHNALLEPVSSVSGLDGSFYYNSTTNVDGTGDALTEEYTAYSPSGAQLTAFQDNYKDGSHTAVGYVDYAFTLKATNTSATTHFVDVTKMVLTYGANVDVPNAFRAAVLVKEWNGSAYPANYTNVTTLTKAADNTAAQALYFTSGQALKAATGETHGSVQNPNGAATIGTLSVGNGETKYFEVVVRLWIEGEDQSCTTDTFAALTEKWSLDLDIVLQPDGSEGRLANPVVSKITTSYADKVDLSGDSASATTKVFNGVTYYQLTTNDTYYSSTASFTSASYVFQFVDDRPVDVTNQVVLPTT